MLNRTSSHICGRWYLPMFLFRDGLLTLMYRASFIALLRFWSSLPTMLKFSTLMLWPVVLKWSNMGEGAFWCSLNLSPKFLRTLLYIPHHTPPCHIYNCRWPTLLHHRIFVLWGHQEVFDGGTSYKVYLNPIVAAFFLDTLTQPLVIWYSYVGFRGVVLLSVNCFVSLFLGWVLHLDLNPV